MEFISNDHSFCLVDLDGMLLDMKFYADEFGIMFYHSPITILKDNSIFSKNLDWLMKQDYAFGHNYSKKDANTLVWLSDQSCDLEDEESVKRVNQLIIEQKEDSFTLSVHNTFLEEIGVVQKPYFVFFSPAGNGYFSRNTKTGRFLQDEMILVFQKSLKGEVIEEKVYQKKEGRL